MELETGGELYSLSYSADNRVAESSDFVCYENFPGTAVFQTVSNEVEATLKVFHYDPIQEKAFSSLAIKAEKAKNLGPAELRVITGS